MSKNSDECNKTFWCITCGKKSQKNSIKEEHFVTDLGIIEHLLDDDHITNLKKFWHKHRLNQTIPDSTPYSIHEDLHKKILSKVLHSEDIFKTNFLKNVQTEVVKVRMAEQAREKMLWDLKMEELRMKRSNHRDFIRGLVNKEPVRPTTSDTTNLPIGPTAEDFMVHKFEEDERKRRGIASNIRTDLSSRHSTLLHSKLWLPYKIRRSLQRSQNVKGLADEVKGHYKTQNFRSASLNNKSNFHQSNGRMTTTMTTNSHATTTTNNHINGHTATTSYDAMNGHTTANNQNNAGIKPYISKRKINNQNGLSYHS